MFTTKFIRYIVLWLGLRLGLRLGLTSRHPALKWLRNKCVPGNSRPIVSKVLVITKVSFCACCENRLRTMLNKTELATIQNMLTTCILHAEWYFYQVQMFNHSIICCRSPKSYFITLENFPLGGRNIILLEAIKWINIPKFT